MTPQEKIARIQAKSQQAKEQARKEKQDKWQRIKTDLPDVAEFLIELNEAFGKPKAVAVKKGNELILKSGEFDKAKELRVKRGYRKQNTPFTRQ